MVKLEVMLCDSLFKLSIYLQVVFLRKTKCADGLMLTQILDLCGLSSEIKTNRIFT